MKYDYKTALDYLYNLEKFGISLGLHKISALLNPFNNPQDKLKVIHIAGTNGKGSTAAILESILLYHGYKVGLYTSPHLVRFNERIRINQQEITDEDIVYYVNKFKPIADKINLKDPVTFFDFTTAVAYKYFYDKNVDFAIMETGLGGTLDSTNIVRKPYVAIITNISLEHEEFLGSTLTDIAREKGGIIKENIITVTGEVKEEPLHVLKKIALEKNSKFFILSESVKIEKKTPYFNYFSKNHSFQKLKINLSGDYQIYNASLSIFSLECAHFNLQEDLLKKALINVKWEGRYEKVKKSPLFIIDGAHNPAGAELLAKNIKKENYSKLILIISVMSDKNIDEIFKKLLPMAHTIIFTKAKLDRAADFNTLQSKAEKFGKPYKFCKNISEAIIEAEKNATNDDLILFTGSLYAAGEAKEFFGGEKTKFSVGNKYK